MKFLKWLGFDPEKHSVRTEILAGLTTFLTMAYILAVNPNVFDTLGGEMSKANGAVFTATALAAIIGTLAMAFIAKKPFALAPGMGFNTFFVYTVCIAMGHSWQFALTAVFIEGVVSVILTLTNVRKWIVDALPLSLGFSMQTFTRPQPPNNTAANNRIASFFSSFYIFDTYSRRKFDTYSRRKRWSNLTGYEKKLSHPAATLRQVQAHEEIQWLSIASRRVANGVQPSGEQRKTKRKASRRLLVQFVGNVKGNEL